MKSLWIRISGLVIVILAITWALHAGGTSFWTRGFIWVLLAFGVLVVGEFYWGSSGKSEQREDVRHGLVEVGLLMASAVAFFWIVHPVAPPPAQPDHITVKLSGKVETAIVEYFQKETPGIGSTPVGPMSIKFSDQIEKDLAAYLEKEHGSTQAPVQTRAVPSLMLGAMALAVVLFFLAFRKTGSEGYKDAPLAALTAIIVATLGALEKLPHLRGIWFRLAWVCPLAVATVCLFGAAYLFYAAHRAKSSGDYEKAWQFFATGLSFGLISWVVLWASPTPTPPPPPPILAYHPSALEKTIFFDRRSTEGREITTLRDAIHGKAKPGDLVLLLGSTECSRVTTGNIELANQRAQEVAKSLGKLNVPVIPYAPSQHESCKPAATLRAVYPVLLRPEKSE